jgi:predicted site-specific integrase-resolvase
MKSINPLLSPSEAARILGVSIQTLANWRAARRYPLTYIKVGGRVMYRLEDLEAFIEGQAIATKEA